MIGRNASSTLFGLLRMPAFVGATLIDNRDTDVCAYSPAQGLVRTGIVLLPKDGFDHGGWMAEHNRAFAGNG
ncbi:MAG: hypothetical protein AAF317_15380 [Pseudomonadota bacterium]